LPVLRQAWRRDPAEKVRAACANALGRLGDLDMVEAFVDALAARAEDDGAAKAAARALGQLGDVRGLAALAAAMLEGWKPAVVVEAMQESGLAALHALVELALREPELAKRQSALTVLKGLAAERVEPSLLAALDGVSRSAGYAESALSLLRLAGAHDGVQRTVAQRVLAAPTGEGRADKALRKAAQAALAPA
jgi:hypothetical protein